MSPTLSPIGRVSIHDIKARIESVHSVSMCDGSCVWRQTSHLGDAGLLTMTMGQSLDGWFRLALKAFFIDRAQTLKFALSAPSRFHRRRRNVSLAVIRSSVVSISHGASAGTENATGGRVHRCSWHRIPGNVRRRESTDG